MTDRLRLVDDRGVRLVVGPAAGRLAIGTAGIEQEFGEEELAPDSAEMPYDAPQEEN